MLQVDVLFRDNQRVSADLEEQLALRESNLAEAEFDNPVRVSWWRSVRAFARRRARDLERAEQVTYAGRFQAHRDRLLSEARLAEAKGRVTEELVRVCVVQDPAVVAAQAATSEAWYEAEVADAACRGFDDRRESLRDLTAKQRKEMELGVEGGRRTIERAMEETEARKGRGARFRDLMKSKV